MIAPLWILAVIIHGIDFCSVGIQIRVLRLLIEQNAAINVMVKRFNGEEHPFQFVYNSAPSLLLLLLLTLFQFDIKAIAHIYNKYS